MVHNEKKTRQSRKEKGDRHEKISLNHAHFVVARRRANGPPDRPIVPRQRWQDIPGWIALLSERGETRKCWDGCPLKPVKHDGRRYGGCQMRGCASKPKAGELIYACVDCKWSVCSMCNDRERMPTLGKDPLFHGPDSPCLLNWIAPKKYRGTVIICPGGNYEFLSPLEGKPVVDWLAKHGITAMVLRHRLLPDYCLDDCLDDLEAATHRVRALREGPVAALGFSAGGHLIASLGLRSAQRSQKQPLDAQVLVYAGFDARDWCHPEYNGFFNKGTWTIPKRAASLHARQASLLRGEEFAAPPTCLVASTEDTYCVNAEHADIYHQHLENNGIANKYICGPFGEHGFQLMGGWTPECIEWLHSRGFGSQVEKECH